jgi:hypothetical protein
MVPKGKVVFKGLDGQYKDDFARRDQIIPQNINPLRQGNPRPVIVETGTIGHFVSILCYKLMVMTARKETIIHIVEELFHSIQNT